MGYSQQFKKFDPISGDVPCHPFSLDAIAQRARAFLHDRTNEQIILIAKKIDSELDAYFADLRGSAIFQLQENLQDSDEYNPFFEWDGGSSANGRWFFKESMEDELDIPTAENTSEVTALKSISQGRDMEVFVHGEYTRPARYVEGEDYEFFAVLALWMLADTLEWLSEDAIDEEADRLVSDLHEATLLNGYKSPTPSINLSLAGDCALKAMDAVCFAEHLRQAEWFVSYATNVNDTKLTEAIRIHSSENYAALGKVGATKRHQPMANLKIWAMAQYRLGEWQSANQAAHALKDGVVKHGRTIKAYLSEGNAQRTIAGWINQAKKNV